MQVTKRSMVVPAGVAVAALALGPIYKWVDEQGAVHYSDQPPPSEQEAEEMVLLPPPSEDDVLAAQTRLDRLVAQQEVSSEARVADRERQRLEQELMEAVRVQRLRRCQRARQNLHVMEIRRPVYSIDDKGEYVYLDEQERAAEMQRMRGEIEENCD